MSGVPDIGIGIMDRSGTPQSMVVVETASKSLFEWACLADPYLIPQ
jgi:hypothetical protein